MRLQDKEGLEIASTVLDVLEGKVKKENKKKDDVQEVEEPKAKGEKDFKDKHVKKVSGMKNDGTNIKEAKKLKAGRGKITIDVDYIGDSDYSKKMEKKFKIKIKSTGNTTADIIGDKKNVLNYMQAKDGHTMDNDDVEELYPEILEGYKKAKKEAVDETELEDDKEETDEASEKQKKYQAFFQKALKKFGVKSPAELEGDKKKEFFDYVDANYEGDNEED
jgi:hypothetical protein